MDQSEELKKTLSGLGSEHSKLKAQKDGLERLCRALQNELQLLRSCSNESHDDEKPATSTTLPIDEASVQEKLPVECVEESNDGPNCNQAQKGRDIEENLVA